MKMQMHESRVSEKRSYRIRLITKKDHDVSKPYIAFDHYDALQMAREEFGYGCKIIDIDNIGTEIK